MTISFKERDYYRDKYGKVSCLFCCFIEDNYLPKEERNDLAVIKTYVSDFDADYLKSALEQLKAVLSLEQFPAEWVIAVTNLIRIHFMGETDAEKTYNWLKWVTETLEVEAKKAGKL
jgi:hypothetical protein